MSESHKANHPGEVLADKLETLGVSVLELADGIKVPNNRLYAIIEGKRSITADTALRLGQFFDTGADYWLNLQKAYELDQARQKLGDTLRDIEPYGSKPKPKTRQASLF